MSERSTFGPRLRRERQRRGISLDTIATVTKVGVELWDGLERGDLSRWPSGIFARAFIRDYARAVGIDADETVDEFCRLFPNGDRRAARIIQGQAAIVGHSGVVAEDPAMVPGGVERRAARPDNAATLRRIRIALRVAAVALDIACTATVGAAVDAVLGTGFWASTGVVAVLYYSISIVALGTTPGLRALDLLRHRMPDVFEIRKAQSTFQLP